jgi:hypothetical protein
MTLGQKVYILNNGNIYKCEVIEIHLTKTGQEYIVRYFVEDSYLTLRTKEVFESIQDLVTELSKNENFKLIKIKFDIDQKVYFLINSNTRIQICVISYISITIKSVDYTVLWFPENLPEFIIIPEKYLFASIEDVLQSLKYENVIKYKNRYFEFQNILPLLNEDIVESMTDSCFDTDQDWFDAYCSYYEIKYGVEFYLAGGLHSGSSE